ncbi:hypothetical protein HYW41_03070 [Candidatus Daviesbacteria bacterium]|nr:hypothetical protein [Candidatus Daviesbacteria bacterium]
MNKKIIIFIISISLLIILAVTGAVLIKKQMIKPVSTPLKTFSTKEDLEQTIKQTFKDPKDQDIVRYVSFASKDRTLETKYIDYSKAYQLIYQRYQNSATIEIKKAVIKLRAYLRPFPQFKEEDFKLPK